MLYTIICILVVTLVALVALAVWVWEVSNHLKRLDESTDTHLGTHLGAFFKRNPSWQFSAEEIYRRIDVLEDRVLTEEGDKYYVDGKHDYSTDLYFPSYQKHCLPIQFLKNIKEAVKEVKEDKNEYGDPINYKEEVFDFSGRVRKIANNLSSLLNKQVEERGGKIDKEKNEIAFLYPDTKNKVFEMDNNIGLINYLVGRIYEECFEQEKRIEKEKRYYECEKNGFK